MGQGEHGIFAQSHLRFTLSEASTPQRADDGFERRSRHERSLVGGEFTRDAIGLEVG